MTTWFNGDTLNGTDLEVQLNSRPRYNGSFSATISNSTNTDLTPTDVNKVGGIIVSGTSITVPTAGEYEIGIYLRYASQATGAGYRVARLNINAADRGWFNNTAVGVNAANTYAGGVERLVLAANDVIVFQAFQTSGGSLTVTGHCWVDRIVQ